ncbi:MAG: RidA family protein [Polyangiaceae bacterium]|nr:RidA family protein [Polyangiaceae bacterium]MCW5791935.1 RidA family protein [Polyangiaceae bacterium]
MEPRPTREVITTPHAPAAIGPYSQAVRAGGFVFVSGQIPMDPQTGELIQGGVGDETDRALKNLEAVLTASQLSLRDVVKTTIYLTAMSDFEAVNQVYARYFSEAPPARATVAVAGLPRGARVEIEAIALARD